MCWLQLEVGCNVFLHKRGVLEVRMKPELKQKKIETFIEALNHLAISAQHYVGYFQI
jgi:hypothetical protein